MASTASYPARQLRRRRKAWMRRHLKIVVLLVVGTLVLGAVVSVVLLLTIPMPVGSTSWASLTPV